MSTRPEDTSLEAWNFRRKVLGGMAGDVRVRTAIDLSEAVREIQLSGLMTRNPAWSRMRAVRHLVLKQTGVDLDAAP